MDIRNLEKASIIHQKLITLNKAIKVIDELREPDNVNKAEFCLIDKSTGMEINLNGCEIRDGVLFEIQEAVYQIIHQLTDEAKGL